MPRMSRRAAVLGATAHVASSRGQAKAEAAAQEQAQQVPPQAAAPQAAPEAAAPEPTDTYASLMKLKDLLDAGS